MITDILELQLAIADYLAADELLSCVEIVSPRPYDISQMPDFDTYAVIVSIGGLNESCIACQMTQETDRIKIYVMVRNFDPVKSIQGQASGEVGVVKLSYLVKDSLRVFGTKNRESLDILGDELDGEIDLQEKVELPGHEGFFRVIRIPYNARLKSIMVQI